MLCAIKGAGTKGDPVARPAALRNLYFLPLTAPRHFPYSSSSFSA